MSVTVYSMENCVQCKQTYMFLDKYGISYNVIDINKDPTATQILDRYNFQSAPVVVVEADDNQTNVQADAWCGFRIDKIKSLKEQLVIA